MTATTLVFVYGTLMRGERYHALLSGCRYRGPARSQPRYRLVDLGEYPALVEGGGTVVVGELFEVPEDVLEGLDRLEGHPDLYRRLPVALQAGVEAVAYVMPAARAQGRDIPSGDWRAHGCRE